MQNIHQLSLVLMQTLYLYIKDRARIYIDTVVLLDISSQTQLVLILDIHELMLSLLIICINLQLFQARQVCYPLLAYMLGYPIC